MAVVAIEAFNEEIVCCQNCGWWDNRDDMSPAEVGAWHDVVNNDAGELCRNYERSIFLTTATGLEWNVHGGDGTLPDGRRYLGRWYATSPDLFSSTWIYAMGQVTESFGREVDLMLGRLAGGLECTWVMPPRWQKTWRRMVRDTCREHGLLVRTSYRQQSLLTCEVKAESNGLRAAS